MNFWNSGSVRCRSLFKRHLIIWANPQATIAQNVRLRSLEPQRDTAPAPRKDRKRLQNSKSRTPNEKRSRHGSYFDQIASSFRFYIRASSDTPKLNAF